MEENMSILNEISTAMQTGDVSLTLSLISTALNENIPADTILNEGLMPGMNEMGEKFRNYEVFVPEVLIAARAMQKGVEKLTPLLQDETAVNRGIAVIGTVRGDMHDIGKNLVRIMLEGKGITVYDLGTDVSAEQFADKAEETGADLICCSALLTTTMPEMKKVVDIVKQRGLKTKVMIGGAPVTQEFCQQIGADCYTDDAASAADEAVRLIEELRRQ